MSKLPAQYMPTILGCKKIDADSIVLLDGLPDECYNHTHPNYMEGVYMHGGETLGWEI